MKTRLFFASLFLLLPLSLACNAARNAGSSAKDASVAVGKEVGDKAEDVADVTTTQARKGADKTAEVAKEGASEVEDGSITTAIKAKFARSDLVDASDIDVDTEEGHVTLKGTVESTEEEQQALTLARSVRGVKSVSSELKIKGSGS